MNDRQKQLIEFAEWVIITNDFTNRTTRVNASRPMTEQKALRIRRRLRIDACMSGDSLGAHGPQHDRDAYSALAARAERAILTGATT